MNSKKTDESNKFALRQALEATRGNRLKEIKSSLKLPNGLVNSTSNILKRYSILMAYEGDMVKMLHKLLLLLF